MGKQYFREAQYVNTRVKAFKFPATRMTVTHPYVGMEKCKNLKFANSAPKYVFVSAVASQSGLDKNCICIKSYGGLHLLQHIALN